MREFIHDGLQWCVREAGPAADSAQLSRRCLIYDSDVLVRRVWVYPETWAELSNEQLWELACGVAHVVLPPIEPYELAESPARPATVLAAETTSRARMLLAQISALRAANRRLREETAALRAACQTSRGEMKLIVQSFASRMRIEGVAPEQAIVRIKGAVETGVGAANAADDPDAETMLRDAVAWGIAAYYAA